MRFNFDAKSVAIALAVAVLLVFGIFPIALLVIDAFIVDGHFSLDNFREVYVNKSNLMAVWNTVKASGLTMLFSTAISFPLAWLVGRTDLPFKNVFRTLIITPYMIPPFIGAFAWGYLANPRIGYLNQWIRAVFPFFEQGPINIYSMNGMVWVLVLFYFPFSFLSISRALEKMDPSLEEAARISGAGPLRVLRNITIPLTAPAIAAGALLVFVAVASAFGIPSIIGGQARIQVVTTRIISYVYVGTTEAMHEATALAVVLLMLSIAVLWFSNWYLAKREYFTLAGKSTRPTLVELGPWKWPLVAVFAIVCFVFAILPIMALVMTSLVKTMGRGFAFDNLTLDVWRSVLADDATWRTLRTSLYSSVLAATGGTLVGLLIAYLKVKTRMRFRTIPDFLATFTNATPGIVLALGLILAFSGKFGLNLYGTFWILVVAYFVRHLSYAVRQAAAALEQVHPSLEEAALSSGASWLRLFKDVTIPLVGPSVVGGWFLVFMPSFYELTMSVLLYSSKATPAGYHLYHLSSYASPQSAAVLSVLILILVLIGNLLMRWASRGRVSL
ncbi:iron(III) transport system permease protein [Symbiobacterium terraclitae]|uniref:Iron(III) transport system permease protein n=1 Tax=Symbiobacterium terraclitae TaxID=557451 RepID=A0ABS4JNW4_9FIRM|nr:iron ABC transporter permease [Symbiobacterium terraclitae]MBP2017213.1 iron(III) transport system permease protein [Symbiobacterium terraclitae]